MVVATSSISGYVSDLSFNLTISVAGTAMEEINLDMIIFSKYPPVLACRRRSHLEDALTVGEIDIIP